MTLKDILCSSKIEVVSTGKKVLSSLDFSVSDNTFCSSEVLEFVSELSDRLIANPLRNKDICALGFFFRKANVQSYLKKKAFNSSRHGMGLSFHIIPSNVPTVALYSALCALVAGNRVVARISDRVSPVLDAQLEIVKALLNTDRFKALSSSLIFIRYSHDSNITQSISSLASSRVIWGGDKTVEAITSIKAKVGCRDVTFPNRHSACIVDLLRYKSLSEEEKQKFIESIEKDLSPFGSLACASPTHIIFSGEDDKSAKEDFYKRLSSKMPDDYLGYSFDRFTNAQLNSAKAIGPVEIYDYDRLTVLCCGLNEDTFSFNVGLGLLVEKRCDNLDELFSVNDLYQTVVCDRGLKEELLSRLSKNDTGLKILRVEETGFALSFSWKQDRYELVEELSCD